MRLDATCEATSKDCQAINVRGGRKMILLWHSGVSSVFHLTIGGMASRYDWRMVRRRMEV